MTRPSPHPQRLSRSQRLGDLALALFFAAVLFALLTHA